MIPILGQRMKSCLSWFGLICPMFVLSISSTSGEEAGKNKSTLVLLDAKNVKPKGTTEKLALDDLGRWRLARAGSEYVAAGEYLSDPLEMKSKDCKISLDWIEQWTAPLHFEKHAGNPIYGPGKSGPWDKWTNGVSIVPTPDGKKYRMYYSGDVGAGIGFAEASVDDPLTWKEHPASPVLKPRADNWEGNKINQPRVVRVTDIHWRMYYTGWGFPGPGKPKPVGSKWAMGIAESFDGGTTWKRWQDEPFLERGDAHSADGGGVCVPMVIKALDQWMMWYTAVHVSNQGNMKIHLCLATSDDGLHWKKYANNPVLTDDFSDHRERSVLSRCYVRHDAGVFRMWFSFSTKQNYRIHYAESLDGIRWEHAPNNPVLNASSKPAWDNQRVEYPEVQIAPPSASGCGGFSPVVLWQQVWLRGFRERHRGNGSHSLDPQRGHRDA